MTLILGVICNDGIVMACDSQATTGDSKFTDATKLHPIQFGKITVLVAEAGRRSYTARYIRILKAIARGSNPEKEQDIADIIQSAMNEFYQSLRRIHGYNSDALAKFLIKQGIDCVLLFGFQIGWKSSLVTMDIHDPICRFADSHFQAHGTGALLGEYLLKEYTNSQLSRQLVLAMAVQIAGVAKQNDIFCGGNTVVGIIQSPHITDERQSQTRLHFIPQKNVEEYSRMMEAVEKKTREFRTNLIQSVFKQNEDKIWKELETIEDFPEPDLECDNGDANS
jgi:20S proteasome alpha/beta subunit